MRNLAIANRSRVSFKLASHDADHIPFRDNSMPGQVLPNIYLLTNFDTCNFIRFWRYRKMPKFSRPPK